MANSNSKADIMNEIKHKEDVGSDDDNDDLDGSIMYIVKARLAATDGEKADDNLVVGVGAASLCAVEEVPRLVEGVSTSSEISAITMPLNTHDVNYSSLLSSIADATYEERSALQANDGLEIVERNHPIRSKDISDVWVAAKQKEEVGVDKKHSGFTTTKNPKEEADDTAARSTKTLQSSNPDSEPYYSETDNATGNNATPSVTPSHPISLPGAYASESTSNLSIDEEESPSEAATSDTGVVDDANPVQATTSDTGLVVANPVQDDEDLNRPIATPTTAMPTLHKQDQWTAADARVARQRKERRCILTLGTLFFLLVVGVVLLVAFPLLGVTTTNNDDDDDRHSTINYPTAQDNVNSTFRPDRTKLSWSEHILAILPNYTIVIMEQDMESLSPQSRAFHWLLDDPNLGNYSDERILQRFSLATLFYSTTPEPQKSIGYDGRGWKNDTGWLQYNTHECDWIFFKIAAWRNSVMKYNVNLKGPCWESDADDAAQGKVYRHLMLPNNGLEGTIPEEIYLLTSLNSVVLDSNALHGTLSTRIGDLSTNLEYFSVSGNRHLEGTLPSEIGMLSKLRYAHLFSNQFTGSLPSQMAFLTSLEILGLFLTSITGTIPEQFASPKMKNLFLSFNQLSGTIPTTMLGSMTKLERLVLKGNQMTGTIPKEMGHLTNCWQLNLEMNDFSGEIPDQLGKLVTNGSLLYVNLTRNSFAGTVPSDLCLLQTPEYQNHTTPPTMKPKPVYMGHDCNGQLCGCNCNCSRGFLY